MIFSNSTLAKRYRKIKLDIQPLIEQLEAGEIIGDQVQGTGYTVFKVRIKNSDIQKGKNAGLNSGSVSVALA